MQYSFQDEIQRKYSGMCFIPKLKSIKKKKSITNEEKGNILSLN